MSQKRTKKRKERSLSVPCINEQDRSAIIKNFAFAKVSIISPFYYKKPILSRRTKIKPLLWDKFEILHFKNGTLVVMKKGIPHLRVCLITLGLLTTVTSCLKVPNYFIIFITLVYSYLISEPLVLHSLLPVK